MSMNLSSDLQRTPTFAGGLLRSLAALLDRVPAWGIILFAECADFLVIQAVALVAGRFLQGPADLPIEVIVAANAAGVACYFSFRQARLYEISVIRNGFRVMRKILTQWSLLCLIIAVSSVILRHGGAKAHLWLLLLYGGGILGFGIERILLAFVVSRWIAQGNHAHAIGIIGSGDLAVKLSSRLNESNAGLKVVGLFGDQELGMAPASVDELLNLAKRDALDTVILAEPDMSVERLHALVRQLRQQPLSIYLMPGAIALEPAGRPWLDHQMFPGFNLVTIADRPINEASLFLKSIFDRSIAFFFLLLISPILLLCALGIKLSGSGPILFRQKRIGYKGREFTIFKFRTMHVAGQPNIKLTERNDPRVFRFGSFLRKTSLDELPQLLNVLRGDMSLVGPRPHMPQATAAGKLYFDIVGDYAARHRVKPGITGWAQINGWRGPTETVEQITARVAHDIYYIENWSPILDITILFRTFFVLFGRNVF